MSRTDYHMVFGDKQLVYKGGCGAMPVDIYQDDARWIFTNAMHSGYLPRRCTHTFPKAMQRAYFPNCGGDKSNILLLWFFKFFF